REDQPALQIELEKGRIRCRGSQPERNEPDVLRDDGILWLQPEQIDALALWPGVGADVHQCLIHAILSALHRGGAISIRLPFCRHGYLVAAGQASGRRW